jgi:hypothetical protein
VENGAYLHATFDNGKTPVHESIFYQKPKTAEYLITKGCKDYYTGGSSHLQSTVTLAENYLRDISIAKSNWQSIVDELRDPQIDYAGDDTSTAAAT